MSKRENKSQQDNVIEEIEKDFVIIEAKIKDDFCDYKVQVLKGVGEGRIISETDKKHIIDKDMRTRFAECNVHLAAVDDVFKHANVEFESIAQVKSHELTFLYSVTGIKIKGGEDNESVVLFGNKYVSTTGGRMEIETPAIPIDNLSSYKWYNELKEVVTLVRDEVEEYRNGKYTVAEDPEEAIGKKKKVKSVTLFNPAEADQSKSGESNISDDEFDNGRV